MSRGRSPVVIEPKDLPEEHRPTDELREQIICMTACGLTPLEIGYCLSLDPVKVIKRHYATEIEHGLVMATAKVGGVVFKAACAGDPDLAKFWLRTRAGWKEAKDPGTKSPNGAELPTESKTELMDRILAMLTPDQVVEVVRSAATDTKPAAKEGGVDQGKPPTSRAH